MTVRIELELDMDSYNKKYGRGSDFEKKYGLAGQRRIEPFFAEPSKAEADCFDAMRMAGLPER